jgi:hypothetical protein
MTNEVKDLLDALHDGNMTLDEVADIFRSRSWPARDRIQPKSYLDAAIADQADPDPYIPNSYDDVATAYDQGRLTDAQFAVLAEAITTASQSEDD